MHNGRTLQILDAKTRCPSKGLGAKKRSPNKNPIQNFTLQKTATEKKMSRMKKRESVNSRNRPPRQTELWLTLRIQMNKKLKISAANFIVSTSHCQRNWNL